MCNYCSLTRVVVLYPFKNETVVIVPTPPEKEKEYKFAWAMYISTPRSNPHRDIPTGHTPQGHGSGKRSGARIGSTCEYLPI